MSMMFFVERDIAIDLGSDNTLVYVSGKGIRLREPTIVAVDRQDGRMLKIGEEARKMLINATGNKDLLMGIATSAGSSFAEIINEVLQ